MGCQSSQAVLDNDGNRIGLNGPIDSINFVDAQRVADELFQRGEFLAAVEAYQKIIESGYTVDFDIEGLGHSDLYISRYEWFPYRWYNDSRKAGKFRGNAFDALSLCLCHIRNTQTDFLDQKVIIWYENMIGERQCVELYIGYANILNNRCRYEEALRYYNKALQIKPNIVNIYTSIMMLYEYRRIQKPKSIAMAKQIQEKFGQEMYSTYVLARNEQDVDRKIEKLKAGHEKYPEYVRMTNDIGIAYGAKKQHRQAILWYKKCIQHAPEYAAAHNNVGVRTEMLKQYNQALPWYLKACELDHQYKAAHGNAIDIFDALKYSDEDILNKMKEFPNLKPFYFFYYLGLAMYDKKRVAQSIKWYKKSEQINNNDYELMNSFGISYDEIKNYPEAEQYYKKAIQIRPTYHNPYYNMGFLHKAQGNIAKAVQWYKKAIQVNPRYHKCYNNLGNIYKDQGQLEKAADCYKKAVESNQTYTLGYINLGVCYLQMDRYQDAFSTFQRGKEIFPTDNNNMSQGNKKFMKDNIEKFNKEGQSWRKTGSIDPAQKQRLRQLIKSFEKSFGQLYSGQKSTGVSLQKTLKAQVLQIVNLLAQDQFSLKEVNKIFELIKHIFHDDEEYFHILPQVFIQYFWNSVFKQKLPILTVEANLFKMVQQISTKQSSNKGEQTAKNLTFNPKLKHYNPPNEFKVNLFKNTSYFKNYQTLYAEIVKVNGQAEKYLSEYIEFVEAVRRRSNGIPYGANMKMPKQINQQFKVILRILEKMFKKEINPERVKAIITKIDEQIKKNNQDITLTNIVHEIMDVWTKEITLILNEREKNKIETVCAISDLLRGKIMFDRVEDITAAVQACDLLCHLRGYEIIELDNRLSKPQTMDVVLKIKVNEAVCELQLAMKQDQSKYHLIHCIYEIERSPLGCIFGSYLFMSKGFNYPLLTNCKDIFENLKGSIKEEDKKAAAAARSVIDALETKNTN